MRYLLSQQRRPLTRRQRWLLIARLLDAIEHDFRAIYPDCIPPFPEGYEESLRQMLIDSKKHFL
ncbi:MAG: hypothetical protein IKH05_02040 [Bacteroidaceae bacterium]|nr:hypothetical protein [Bacteroidaceae bacterium]